MNNDNFRRDREEEDRRDRRDREERRDDRREERQEDRFDRQFFDQFGPGRFPAPPIPPIPPMPPRMEEPRFDRMRMEGPRTAPPNFIPQFEEERFGRHRDRDIRRCINRFTFIWLNNGNSFWFFPVFVGREQVVGFRWRRNGWMFDRLNLRRIAGFRCF